MNYVMNYELCHEYDMNYDMIYAMKWHELWTWHEEVDKLTLGIRKSTCRGVKCVLNKRLTSIN